MKKIISLFTVVSLLCCSMGTGFADNAEDMPEEPIEKIAFWNEPSESEPEKDSEKLYDIAETEEYEYLEQNFAQDRVIVKIKDSISLMSAEEDATFFGVDVSNVETLSSIDNSVSLFDSSSARFSCMS